MDRSASWCLLMLYEFAYLDASSICKPARHAKALSQPFQETLNVVLYLVSSRKGRTLLCSRLRTWNSKKLHVRIPLYICNSCNYNLQCSSPAGNFSLNRNPWENWKPLFFVLLRVHICRDSDTPKVRVTGSVSTSTSGAGVVPGPRQTGTGSARYCHNLPHIFIRFIPCLCSLQEEGSSASCQHQPMLPERNSCGKLLQRIEIVRYCQSLRNHRNAPNAAANILQRGQFELIRRPWKLHPSFVSKPVTSKEHPALRLNSGPHADTMSCCRSCCRRPSKRRRVIAPQIKYTAKKASLHKGS